MSYTVKQLAKLSKVSVRTLHYYDEIGLLTPAYHGKNGYRYYEDKQLLELQQIMFYRELDFPLKEIQKILRSGDFEPLKALVSHRKVLQIKLERFGELLQTLDKTIRQIKEEKKMSQEEMYHGFSKEKQEGYENYLVDRYGEGNLIAKSKEKVKRWDRAKWDGVKKELNDLNIELVALMAQNLEPDAKKVQEVIGRHYRWIQQFYEPTKEVYVGLGHLYNDHPDFQKYYEGFDPKLAPFLQEAMQIFAEKNL